MRKLLTETDDYVYSTKILQLFKAHGYAGIGLLHMIRVRIAQHELPIDKEELKYMLKVTGDLEEIWNFLIDNDYVIEKDGEIHEESALENAEIYKKRKNHDRDYQKSRRERIKEVDYNMPRIE
jgi:hypothetical protein